MEKNLKKIIKGYKKFKHKYAHGNKSIMKHLSLNGQKPEILIIACCDSRADPALILQCDPGDLFVIRNVANIVPPFEKDNMHHGTSAALEFGICHLKVRHLILLGHSQCGGISSLLNQQHNNNNTNDNNDFISNWVSIINLPSCIGDAKFTDEDIDNCAKLALKKSYNNCLSFSWLKERVEKKELNIHLWFFDIKTGQIFTYSKEDDVYYPLDPDKKTITFF